MLPAWPLMFDRWLEEFSLLAMAHFCLPMFRPVPTTRMYSLDISQIVGHGSEV